MQVGGVGLQGGGIGTVGTSSLKHQLGARLHCRWGVKVVGFKSVLRFPAGGKCQYHREEMCGL